MNFAIRSLLILAFFAYSALSCQPIFQLHETYGWGDEYRERAVELVTITDEPDLVEKGFTFLYSEYICITGVWIGYREPAYFGRSTLYGENLGVTNCRYTGSPNYYRSVKIVGDPNDYYASALVTFMQTGLEWAQTTYLNDTAQMLNVNIGSFIVMGSEELEIFTEPDFQGESFCIGPNNGNFYSKNDFDERNHWRNGTRLFTAVNYAEEFLANNKVFNSFRFGCSESSKKNLVSLKIKL